MCSFTAGFYPGLPLASIRSHMIRCRVLLSWAQDAADSSGLRLRQERASVSAATCKARFRWRPKWHD